MNQEGKTVKNDYLLPALFAVAVVLVFVSLIVSIIVDKNGIPSVKNGATTKQIESYAQKLLSKDNGTNAIGYNEATSYYTTQIKSASDEEQKFNLQLDFAIFYGETGDPSAGLQVLDDVDANSLPLDAKYYLYSTYVYLYERLNDEALANEYRQKIVDDGINEYFAGLDDGSITPEPKDKGGNCTEDCNASDSEDTQDTSEEEIFNEEAL